MPFAASTIPTLFLILTNIFLVVFVINANQEQEMSTEKINLNDDDTPTTKPISSQKPQRFILTNNVSMKVCAC
jgi:hypothetical protein